MNNNRLLKLAFLWLIAVLLLLTYLFYDATEQISILDSQIEQRDSLIKELSTSNDLIKEYFDVKYDSVKKEKIYVLKDSKKTKVEVEKWKAIHDVEYIKSEDRFYKNGKRISSDSLIKEYNNLSQRNTDDWKKLVERYKLLVHDYNKLGLKLSKIEDSLWVKNLLLKNIEKYYKIQYNYGYKGNQVITNLSSEKLDSALMLLDIYRDKLKYNPQKKQWTIKRQVMKFKIMNSSYYNFMKGGPIPHKHGEDL